MRLGSTLGFTGTLKTRVIRKPKPSVLTRLRKRIHNMAAVWNGAAVLQACLKARHYVAAEDKWYDLGVVSRRVVTDAYVNLLVDELQSSQAIHSTLKWHDSGTGVVAENQTDTALGTPCGEARDDGTQIEGATANIYKTVATHTYAGSFAITEHGVFSANAAGTLLDRSVFAAINVAASDQIEFTYELTCTAGG